MKTLFLKSIEGRRRWIVWLGLVYVDDVCMLMYKSFERSHRARTRRGPSKLCALRADVPYPKSPWGSVDLEDVAYCARIDSA